MPDRAYAAAAAFAVVTAAIFARVLAYEPVLLAPIEHGVSYAAPETNLVLHALAGALVLLLCIRATGQLAPSLLAAALFAWHPLRVESIASPAAGHGMHAATAALVTIVAYHAWGRRGGAWRYATAVAAYAAAVAAAAPWVVVPVPLLLLLLDTWPLARLDVAAPARDPRLACRLVEKVPFGVLAAAPIALASLTHTPIEGSRVGVRLATAFANVVRYVASTVAPLALTPMRPATPPPWWTPGAVIAIAATTVGLVAARKRAPAVAIGWLWFLVAALPIVGRTPADRFIYVASIGLALAIASAVAALERGRTAATAVALVAVTACVAATERQITRWRDEDTVLRHALAVTDENFGAQLGLATLLVARRAWAEAAEHAAEAVRLRPDDADAQNVLGEVRLHEGHVDAAAEHFARAVAARPEHVRARSNLGRAEQRRGRLDAAIAAYRDVIERAPDTAHTHEALARVLRRRGDLAEARRHFERALALGAAPAEVLRPLAQTLAEAGDLDGAVARYRDLLALTPNDAAAHDRLGTLMVRRGDLAAAEREYRTARELRPDLAEAELHLGIVRAARGALDDALAAYEAALRLAPDLPSAQYNRAVALEARGDAAAARAALRAELAVQPNWPPALLRLAALLAVEGGAGAEARALVDRAAGILGVDDPDVQATRRLVDGRPHAHSP